MRRIGFGMIAVLTLGLIAVGCTGNPGGSGHAGGDVAWERDLNAALARAGAENKIVMVDFYTDWCGWCKRLDETTYADAAVRDALAGMVAVKLNAEKEGRGDATRYRVAGYPTIVFLAADGREVGRIGGYLPPQPFLEEVRDILART